MQYVEVTICVLLTGNPVVNKIKKKNAIQVIMTVMCA